VTVEPGVEAVVDLALSMCLAAPLQHGAADDPARLRQVEREPLAVAGELVVVDQLVEQVRALLLRDRLAIEVAVGVEVVEVARQEGAQEQEAGVQRVAET